MKSKTLNPMQFPSFDGLGVSRFSPPMEMPKNTDVYLKSAKGGGAIGLATGNPMAILGIGKDLFGASGFGNVVDSLGLGSLFGQTSLATISGEGAEIVKNAYATFQQELASDSSRAFTNLSKTLMHEEARYWLMLENASSNRTKGGLPISLKAIRDGIANISEFENKFKSQYNIKKTPGEQNRPLRGRFSPRIL